MVWLGTPSFMKIYKQRNTFCINSENCHNAFYLILTHFVPKAFLPAPKERISSHNAVCLSNHWPVIRQNPPGIHGNFNSSSVFHSKNFSTKKKLNGKKYCKNTNSIVLLPVSSTNPWIIIKIHHCTHDRVVVERQVEEKLYISYTYTYICCTIYKNILKSEMYNKNNNKITRREVKYSNNNNKKKRRVHNPHSYDMM